MNWGVHPRQVTWKDGYRDILAIHSETVQRLRAALGVSGRGQDLDGLTKRATTCDRATGSAGVRSHQRRDTVGEWVMPAPGPRIGRSGSSPAGARRARLPGDPH